ncbi:hypothetical protein QR685DRAFT_447386, partial [Neurospora intermedia]
KLKKNILIKKVISTSTNTFANNVLINLTTPATTINSTLLYKGRIFIGLNGLGGSNIDFC